MNTFLLNRFLLLPLLVMVLSFILVVVPQGQASLIAVMRCLCIASLVYAGLLYVAQRLLLRMLLAFLLSLSLFTQLAYQSAISISMIMSTVDTSSSEAFEFVEFHCLYALCAISCFFALLFLPARFLSLYKKWLFAAGFFYLFSASPLFAYEVMTTNQFEQQLRAARARGLSMTIAKAELVIEEAATRFSVLHWVKAMVDLQLIVTSKQNSAVSSWTNVRAAANSPELLVLGIGESERAANMSLYGYERQTTPHLSEHLLRKNIGIIAQAYSAGPTTWTALPASLTFGQLEPDFSKSIINLAKDAGYKTYWISNQGLYGATERSVATIAAQADSKFFNQSEGRNAGLDAVLIEQLIKTLKEERNTKKKLIVLHFYGSHMLFNQRYPRDFARFNADNSLTDQYDNSILYNDFLLDQVISVVSDADGQFLYFADHGLRRPELSNPLTHDNTDNPDIDSFRVPLLFTLPSSIKPHNKVALFYFECLFAEWAQITAAELVAEDYCNAVNNLKTIPYYDVRLTLRNAQLH
jgi:heptose-I-phosphate ethanolaminephosphotransferase